MSEEVINIYCRYLGEDPDLAISLTARAVAIEEWEVRQILEV